MIRSAALAVLLTALPAHAQPLGWPGEETYRTHCTQCHGADGRPQLAGTPDFTIGQGLRRSDAQLIDAIRFGIGTMPGFQGMIESEELIDVVFYIRTLER